MFKNIICDQCFKFDMKASLYTESELFSAFRNQTLLNAQLCKQLLVDTVAPVLELSVTALFRCTKHTGKQEKPLKH